MTSDTNQGAAFLLDALSNVKWLHRLTRRTVQWSPQMKATIMSKNAKTPSTGLRGRDAGTGQFVPVKEARQDKRGSIVETFKKDTHGRPIT